MERKLHLTPSTHLATNKSNGLKPALHSTSCAPKWPVKNKSVPRTGETPHGGAGLLNLNPMEGGPFGVLASGQWG